MTEQTLDQLHTAARSILDQRGMKNRMFVSDFQGDGFTEPFALITVEQQADGTARLRVDNGYDTAESMYRHVIQTYGRPQSPSRRDDPKPTPSL